MIPLLLHTGQAPGLHWTPHLDIVLLCLVLLTAYFYVITELRPRLSDAGRVRRRQVALFVAGVVSLYFLAGPPLHDLADKYLLTAHMFEHMGYMLIVAPLFIAGIPAWFWQALLRGRRVQRVARFMTHPLVVLATVNGTLLLAHLPGAVHLQLDNELFHFVVHAGLLGAGFLMWWPILSPVPEVPRFSEPVQIGYLFVQSILPTVLASFVTFADSVVYQPYAEAPRIWGISAITDQQIAGGLMKVLGSLVLWTFMGVAFFRWYQRERAQEQPPRWPEVERELEELGLTRR